MVLPRAVADSAPLLRVQNREHGDARIGYAGEIAPGRGLEELCDWTLCLRRSGYAVGVYIWETSTLRHVGNADAYREKMLERFKACNIVFVSEVDRDENVSRLLEMDYVWCFRAREFEDATYTACSCLVEMAAAGALCLCYPGKVNKEILGEEYPGYIKDYCEL